MSAVPASQRFDDAVSSCDRCGKGYILNPFVPVETVCRLVSTRVETGNILLVQLHAGKGSGLPVVRSC